MTRSGDDLVISPGVLSGVALLLSGLDSDLEIHWLVRAGGQHASGRPERLITVQTRHIAQ
jgi:hypothetical protein